MNKYLFKSGAVIALCGVFGSGKTTFESVFMDHFKVDYDICVPVLCTSFGLALKQLVSRLFEWPLKTLMTGSERNIIDVEWSSRLGDPNFSPLTAMQIIGTALRKQWPQIWIAPTRALIDTWRKNNSTGIVLITDARFPDEMEYIKNGLHGKIIWMWRNDANPAVNKLIPVHTNETSWLDSLDLVDYVFFNNFEHLSDAQIEMGLVIENHTLCGLFGKQTSNFRRVFLSEYLQKVVANDKTKTDGNLKRLVEYFKIENMIISAVPSFLLFQKGKIVLEYV